MAESGAETVQPVRESRLEHMPISYFASVMGLAGLTLALHALETYQGWGGVASLAALVVTIAAFAVVAVFYGLKALRYPGAVSEEWHHPVRLAFFPAISISVLLIATALRPVSADLARPIWMLGTVLQGALTLAVVSGWIGRRPFQPMHISPAWFIPAVGNVVVPVAGVSLGYAEISWLFFSAGVMFWIVLLTLVMNRLIFHDPLPARLFPTLVILIAPPAVAFLSWLQLNGGVVDGLARLLFYLAFVFAAIVATQARTLLSLPFAMSFWALSFPMAALTISTFRYADLTQSGAHGVIGMGFMIVLIVILATLIARTALAIARDEICHPE